MAIGKIQIQDLFLYPEWSSKASVEYGTFGDLYKQHTFLMNSELFKNRELPVSPLFIVKKESLKNHGNNLKEMSPSEYSTFSLREFEELAMLGFIFCNISNKEILNRVVNAWVKKYTLPCYTAVKEYRRPRGFYRYSSREVSSDTAMRMLWELAYNLEELNPKYYFVFESTLRGMAFDAYFVYMALLISYEKKPIINLVEMDMAKNEILRDKLYKTFIEHAFLQSQKLEGKYETTINFALLSRIVLGYIKQNKWLKDFGSSMEKAKAQRTNEAIRLVEEEYGSDLYASICSVVDEYIYRVSSCTKKPHDIKSFVDIVPAYTIPDKLSKVWFDCYNFIVFNAKDTDLCVKRCARPQCGSLFITAANKKTGAYCCDNCREVYGNFTRRKEKIRI